MLSSPAATERLAEAIAPHLKAGDFVALSGDLGAGKSVLARALIAKRLAALGRSEAIPSPTYTLVQVYDVGGLDSGTPISTGSAIRASLRNSA